ncbi:hypothetical protein [Ilumatobacter sp.]|uniref:hypothetical protein n=1 Tax=Ilumatobacter sp. TaxID=1967498 RepID=UPI003B5300CB
MLAAPVWHFWIGAALVAVAVLAVIGLGGYYLWSVQAKKYPTGRQARHRDL